MSEKETGGQAFPLGANEYAGHGPQAGMTLRDYFAAKAMQSILIGESWKASDRIPMAKEAYELADAMLAERAK